MDRLHDSKFYVPRCKLESCSRRGFHIYTRSIRAVGNWDRLANAHALSNAKWATKTAARAAHSLFRYMVHKHVEQKGYGTGSFHSGSVRQ
jgi:hypothetical protein